MTLNLGEPRAGRVGTPCSVGAWLQANPDDADELRTALADRRWSVKSLVTALAERGVCCDSGCRHCPWVGA